MQTRYQEPQDYAASSSYACQNLNLNQKQQESEPDPETD